MIVTIFHKVALLPNIYAKEVGLAHKHGVHGTALDLLLTAEKEMLKALADLEKQAAVIWRKYTI